MDVLQDRSQGGAGRSRVVGRRSLSRLSAAAFTAAVVVTGAALSADLLADDDDGGLGVLITTQFWVLAAVVLTGLALPTWLGSRWLRRVLGVASLAGFAGALHWLSYEPGDTTGYLKGITVAALLAVATAAAALAERAR